ncbi:MAG TPA: hypothetical protein VL463_12675 [Kofleriaceae bacterium]|nr:hypothetical protein [Kofleriaceae bacterium]
MLLASPAHPTPLDELRRAYRETAEIETKRAAGQVLATALYQASREARDDVQARALADEARATLTELSTAASAAGGVSEVTLRMLAVLDIMHDDYAAAADIYAQLEARFPTSPWSGDDRLWRAYCDLRLNRDADALALVDGAAPNKDAPELSYVIAWARWRNGDGPGAVAAITVAARAWTSASTRLEVQRDAIVMLARSGVPADRAAATVTALDRGTHAASLLRSLHDAYAYAGRWNDAIAVAEILARQSGLGAEDVAALRADEARDATRMMDTEHAATLAALAVAALDRCGAGCAKETRDLVARTVHDLALYDHSLYAASFDARLLESTRALYALYARLPDRADATTMHGYAAQLEQTAARAPRGRSPLSAAVIGAVLGQRAQEVQACYERALVAAPSAKGTLTLHVRFAGDGSYVEGRSEPAGADDPIARVGACALHAASSWRLPPTSGDGVEVALPYELAPSTGTHG